MEKENWKRLIDHHTFDWRGIWTKYNAGGEVVESFNSLRSFKVCNEEQTHVRHSNQYKYSEERIEEKSWDIFFKDCRPTGVVHPFNETMTAKFFESGQGAWSPEQCDISGTVLTEIFMPKDKIRNSAAIVYKGGELFRVESIREDSRGYPSQHWSSQVEALSERSLTGNWQGVSVTLSPDLTTSQEVPTKRQWGGWEGHQEYFLPDGVTISCPKKIEMGVAFVLAVNWLVTDSAMQQMTVKYDKTCSYVGMTLDLLELQTS